MRKAGVGTAVSASPGRAARPRDEARGRQRRVRPVAAAPRLAARKGNSPMVPRLRDGPSHRAGADEEARLIGRKERAATTGTNPENTTRGERKPGSRRRGGKTPRVPDVQKRQVYRTGRRPGSPGAGGGAGGGVYSELTCVPNRIQPIPKPQKLRWDPLCEGASQVGLGTDLDMQSGRFGAGPAPDDQSH